MRNSKPHLRTKRKVHLLALRKPTLQATRMASELWQRLRGARKYGDKTQQDVADACSVSREAVSQWETPDPSKRTSPNIFKLKLVSNLTGAPMEWLLNDESDLTIEQWLDAPTAPSAPNRARVDASLLARAIAEAQQAFRIGGRSPTDTQLGVAAAYYYELVRAGRDVKRARREVAQLLQQASGDDAALTRAFTYATRTRDESGV